MKFARGYFSLFFSVRDVTFVDSPVKQKISASSPLWRPSNQSYTQRGIPVVSNLEWTLTSRVLELRHCSSEERRSLLPFLRVNLRMRIGHSDAIF